MLLFIMWGKGLLCVYKGIWPFPLPLTNHYAPAFFPRHVHSQLAFQRRTKRHLNMNYFGFDTGPEGRN
jgi:hypothetical protein